MKWNWKNINKVKQQESKKENEAEIGGKKKWKSWDARKAIGRGAKK